MLRIARIASVTLLSALMLLAVGAIQPSDAASSVRLGCRKSKCTFEEQLGKSMTKEFVAVCHNGVYPYPWDISVRKKASNTTCTTKCRGGAKSDGSDAYITKSCTNWNPLSRDALKITVECGDWPKTSGELSDICSDSITSD